jgi:[ribosomal protein S18]-alanine N-acetyltransferase
MSVILHAAREVDLSALARLHAACFPDDAWNAAALATVLAMPGAGGRVICAETGALCGLLLDQCLGAEGEILTLGVAPEWRRQGMARRLLSDLLVRARAAGVRRLALEVAADNTAGIALYERVGFHRDGTRRGYYRRRGGPPVDAWRLGLDIPQVTLS